MKNEMYAPPSVKGIEAALGLLAVVQTAKDLEKRLLPLKKYVDEANKHWNAYGGMEKALRKVEDDKLSLENAWANLDNEVETLKEQRAELKAERLLYKKKMVALQSKINKRASEVAAIEATSKERTLELDKAWEKLTKDRLANATERQNLAQLRADTEKESKKFLEARQLLGV